jgi:type III restriction enzyme
MLQEIRNLQGLAVGALAEELKTTKKEITFKAPTGSGKTYMMADFMNRALAEKGANRVFIVSSLSKGGLARQNYEKFIDYKDRGLFGNLDPYLINSDISGEERLCIPATHNVYVLPRDLYKRGGRLMQGAMKAFLHDITPQGALKNKTLILIRDECHVATKNLDDLSDDFHKIINFSATPKLSRGQNPDVEIKAEDAVNSKLIKSIEWGADADAVEDAVAKFERIKEDYRNHLGVNPCLIIQISNKDKADEELSNAIMPAIRKTALKWMLIVNEDKNCDTNDNFKAKKLPVAKWKDYAKSNTAEIDIIIFKMVISEGWDIPRACMLYQVRDTKSKQLDEQVIGRVRRNPRLLDFETLPQDAQRLAMTAWVWGIKGDKTPVLGVRLHGNPADTTDNIKIKTTRLKGLTEKRDFNLANFLAGKKPSEAPASIFDLAKKLEQADNDVIDMVYSYAADYSKWRLAAENIGEIAANNSDYKCDYAQSMEIIDTEVSFPLQSCYTDYEHYLRIGDWVWERRDNIDRFSFDSEAEREWAEILKELSIRAAVKSVTARGAKKDKPASFFDNAGDAATTEEKTVFLWGKNYVPNSAIKFEYYLGGVHSSYPDFVMKDSFDRIHIFEVKCLNLSSQQSFDSRLYMENIAELKKCYKQASALTKQIFYIPVLYGETWKITRYFNGNEEIISKDAFVDAVRNK